VTLPDSLSTTELQQLLADEASFIKSLVRPMPKQPSTAARRGTRFHAWVESQFGQQPLLSPDDLPGAADADIDSDAELEVMQQRFLELPYAALDPFAIEEPFAITLGGRLFTGRIDAIFRHPQPDDPMLRWEVVDWKTNREANADPLQLAVYRIAWAEKLGIDLDQVDAAFVYVRFGEVHRFGVDHAPLPDRSQLERLITNDGPNR
jgi:DNA helicase-2/ATP-dependent DNA helicase PcrA